MKTFLYTIFIALSGTTFAQETKSEDHKKEYKAMALEMCGCVNSNSTDLSKEMRKAIVQGVKDGNMAEAVQKQALKDTEQGKKDIDALLRLPEAMEPCMSAVELKYNYLYLLDGHKVVQEEVKKAMAKNKKCDLCYALTIVGQQAMEEESEQKESGE